MASTNISWVIRSPKHLVQKSSPKPVPGPHQVLVRISAASINYRDVLIYAHSPIYPVTAAPDLVPCCDGAGVVEAIGPSSNHSVGQHVTIHQSTWRDGEVANFDVLQLLGGGEVPGTLQRYMVVDDWRAYPAPANLDDVEVAALLTAGGTAWNALFEGHIVAGEGITVLTQGTGGVSTAAIQLARAAGATVIATSSSDEKLKVVRRLGAEHLINYRKTPNWADEVLRITGGKGVDIVVEVAGAETIEESLKSTRQGGLVAVIGLLSKSTKADLIPYILYGARTVKGVLGAGSIAMAMRMKGFVEKHDIHPVVARVFPFEEAEEAFASMETQKEIGKIVIKV